MMLPDPGVTVGRSSSPLFAGHHCVRSRVQSERQRKPFAAVAPQTSGQMSATRAGLERALANTGRVAEGGGGHQVRERGVGRMGGWTHPHPAGHYSAHRFSARGTNDSPANSFSHSELIIFIRVRRKHHCYFHFFFFLSCFQCHMLEDFKREQQQNRIKLL